MEYLLQQIKDNRWIQFIAIAFVIFTGWWITIYFRDISEGLELDWWSNLMVVFPLFGGIGGLLYARLWGGMKSLFGSAMLLLSFGLLCQFLGTAIYFYYVYVIGVEIPYPSPADAAYVAGIIFYIFGSYKLAKVSGVKLSSLAWSSKLFAIIIPSLILLVSYLVLMRDYNFEEATSLLLFLDFGWLIGQAIYVSIAILTYLGSSQILGGMMRKPVILLLIALIAQYLADFHYSYQISVETYVPGGINDILYALAFFLMALSLFSIGNMFYKVQKS